jgi:hypothetical protein
MPEPKPGVVEIIRVEPLARHISELTIQAPDEQSRVNVRPAHLQVQAASVVDPDRIRIEIGALDSGPDPGGQKRPKKKKK